MSERTIFSPKDVFISWNHHDVEIKNRVKDIIEEKGYSVHKLRHTAATLMYGTGKVDVRVLKDILGHEQLNTTQIYTHLVSKNLEEAMDNNPLSDVILKSGRND